MIEDQYHTDRYWTAGGPPAGPEAGRRNARETARLNPGSRQEQTAGAAGLRSGRVRRRSGSALLGGRGDDRVRPADSGDLEDGWTAGAVVKETRLGRVCRRGTVVPSDRRLHARPFPRYCSSATAPAGPPHRLRHLPAHVGVSGKVKPSEGIGSKLFA